MPNVAVVCQRYSTKCKTTRVGYSRTWNNKSNTSTGIDYEFSQLVNIVVVGVNLLLWSFQIFTCFWRFHTFELDFYFF
jgi:hypothetical protein